MKQAGKKKKKTVDIDTQITASTLHSLFTPLPVPLTFHKPVMSEASSVRVTAKDWSNTENEEKSVTQPRSH
jgi:hypothetical protein